MLMIAGGIFNKNDLEEVSPNFVEKIPNRCDQESNF